MVTPERRMQIDAEIQASRAARIGAGLPTASPEAGERDEPAAPGFNMAVADVEFPVAQTEDTAEQQAILESIQDEAEVKANQVLIRKKQTEADALFNELGAEIAAKEAKAKAPEGPELQLSRIYPPEGAEIIDISHKE
ncbi:hypothetical protein D1007_27305 [Hordeum vulgare]|nr:hypothetical protein D1007_27305 [Hordeum vulgare]